MNALTEARFTIVPKPIIKLSIFVPSLIALGMLFDFNLPDFGQSFVKEDIFNFGVVGTTIFAFLFLNYARYKISKAGISFCIFNIEFTTVPWSKYSIHKITEKVVEVKHTNASNDSKSKYIEIPVSQVGQENFNTIKAYFEEQSSSTENAESTVT